MGILQVIRTKFGADVSDSAALTQALGDLNERINKNRVDAAAIEAAIPGAVIASIDGAATERRRLQALDSEHMALVKAVLATRREIEQVREREKALGLDREWDAAAEAHANVVKAANNLDALVGMMDAGLMKLRDAIEKFETALPVRSAEYHSSLLPFAVNSVVDALKARMANNGMPVRSIRAMADEDCRVAFKARPAKEESAQSTSVTGDSLVEQGE